jgi:hypothetical protein
MADFCRQCTAEIFDQYCGDFVNITTLEDWRSGKAAVVLCEGCGPIQVDPSGNCVSEDCLKKHGLKSNKVTI